MTLDDSVLQSLEIDFSVNLNWLTENNIDKENVTLTRYNDGIWEKLSTTYISEDDIYMHTIMQLPLEHQHLPLLKVKPLRFHRNPVVRNKKKEYHSLLSLVQ